MRKSAITFCVCVCVCSSLRNIKYNMYTVMHDDIDVWFNKQYEWFLLSKAMPHLAVGVFPPTQQVDGQGHIAGMLPII